MRPPESASASLLPLFIGHDKALNRSQSDSPSGGSDCPEQLVYSDERHVAIGIGAQRSDPNRLYVAGHSAGGHLTAVTMPLAEVRGGIAISGIFDLEPIRLNYLNEKLALDTAEAERNSPVRHLPATARELVVAYGTR